MAEIAGAGTAVHGADSLLRRIAGRASDAAASGRHTDARSSNGFRQSRSRRDGGDSSRIGTMHFELTQDFPAGLERLWATLGRADYVERKYLSLGSTALQVLKFCADGASIEVELARQAPVAWDLLPVWARAFSGRQQAMHQHTRWTRAGPDRIDVRLEIRAPGKPVSATGSGSVVESPAGHSRMTLQFNVVSTSPALKAGVARLFARQVKHALQADHAFTLGYLRESPRQR